MKKHLVLFLLYISAIIIIAICGIRNAEHKYHIDNFEFIEHKGV